MSSRSTRARELAFVVDALPHPQFFVDSLRPDVDLVMLDASRDGLAQIAEALAARPGLDAVHLFSHGSNAVLDLGATVLASDTLTVHAEQIARIAQLLDGAALRLYACDLASLDTGRAFVDRLADLLDTSVEASLTPTGDVDGADWTLAYAVGAARHGNALRATDRAAYAHTLGTPPTAFIAMYATDDTGSAMFRINRPITTPANDGVYSFVVYKVGGVTQEVTAIAFAQNTSTTVSYIAIDAAYYDYFDEHNLPSYNSDDVMMNASNVIGIAVKKDGVVVDLVGSTIGSTPLLGAGQIMTRNGNYVATNGTYVSTDFTVTSEMNGGTHLFDTYTYATPVVAALSAPHVGAAIDGLSNAATTLTVDGTGATAGAQVIAWFDFDKNGAIDPGERSMVANADANGAWTADFSLVGIDDGAYQLRVKPTAGGATSAASALTLDRAAPTLAPAQSTPVAGATGVSVTANLDVAFSETIKLGTAGQIVLMDLTSNTVVQTFDLSQSGNGVTVNGSHLVIDPAANLQEGTSYGLTFTAGAVNDVAGNALAQISDAGTFSFTSIVVPAAVGAPILDTASGTKDVTNATAPGFHGTGAAANASVTVWVDENKNGALDAGEYSTVTVANGAGDWNASITTDKLTDGVYAVKATQTLNGVVGHVSGALTLTIDRTVPVIDPAGSQPQGGATNVALSAPIAVHLSEAASFTHTGQVRLVKVADGSVVQTYDLTHGHRGLEVSGQTLTVTPSAALDAGTAYALEFDAGVLVDAAGNPLAAFTDHAAYTFTTVVRPAAVSAPVLDAASGANGLTKASLITLTGSGAAASGLVTVWIDADGNQQRDAGERFITGNADALGTWSLTVDATSLTDGSYQVLATQTAVDAVSPASAGLTLQIDRTVPTIDATASTPAANATEVDLWANLSLKLSEGVSFGTSGSITLVKVSDGSTVQTFDVANPGSGLTLQGDVLTIDPAQDLQAGTAYALKFSAGALVDAAGNGLAAIDDVSGFSFTTLVPVPSVTPGASRVTVLDTAPTLDANGVPLPTSLTPIPGVVREIQTSHAVKLGTGVDNLVLTGATNVAAWDNAGNNVIFGNAGANVTYLSGGNDIVDGGAGYDSLVLAGARSQYTVSIEHGIAVVRDIVAGTTTHVADMQVISFGGAAHSDLDGLFQAHLGRAPTGDEQAQWARAMADGTSLADVSASLASSVEASQANVGVDDFLGNLYRGTLGREPDAEGLAWWRAQMTDHGLTRAQAAIDFVASAEHQTLRQSLFTTNQAELDGLYKAFFGRSVDQSGLDFWMQASANGVDLKTMAAQLTASTEFAAHAAGMSTQDVVTGIYTQLLGRAPDQAGLDFWTAQVDSGAPISLIGAAIVGSDEFQHGLDGLVARADWIPVV